MYSKYEATEEEILWFTKNTVSVPGSENTYFLPMLEGATLEFGTGVFLNDEGFTLRAGPAGEVAVRWADLWAFSNTFYAAKRVMAWDQKLRAKPVRQVTIADRKKPQLRLVDDTEPAPDRRAERRGRAEELAAKSAARRAKAAERARTKST